MLIVEGLDKYLKVNDFIKKSIGNTWLLSIYKISLKMDKTPPKEYPGYDTKQSDDEVPVILELWRMRSTPLLPSLPGPLWPRVVAPDQILFMD